MLGKNLNLLAQQVNVNNGTKIVDDKWRRILPLEWFNVVLPYIQHETLDDGTKLIFRETIINLAQNIRSALEGNNEHKKGENDMKLRNSFYQFSFGEGVFQEAIIIHSRYAFL